MKHNDHLLTFYMQVVLKEVAEKLQLSNISQSSLLTVTSAVIDIISDGNLHNENTLRN